jgi:UDP-N-acetylglucosamine 2-epimerase (non-hydrolysing)
MAFFGIRADHDLDVMRPDQSLTGLAARMLEAMQRTLDEVKPAWIVVQGDTTTAMTASLAAFYNRVKVAHVEAGLRTGNRYSPYPEEVNRRVIAVIADFHFPPTREARDALISEGGAPETIVVTGNTGIDSLLWTLNEVRAGRVTAPESCVYQLGGRRLVLVTAHRRESFDGGLAEICKAIRIVVSQFEDIVVVLPVHPNPNVKGPIESHLRDLDRVCLVEPIEYGPFVALLDRAVLVLTDSGGIQEEATTLGKPMLVMRETTERPEALAAGCARLVGADRDKIATEAARLLSDPAALAKMSLPSSAFGDGRAAERIAAALARVAG